MAIAGGAGRRSLVSVGLSATQSRHARNGSRTREEWTTWFSEPAKNALYGVSSGALAALSVVQAKMGESIIFHNLRSLANAVQTSKLPTVVAFKRR